MPEFQVKHLGCGRGCAGRGTDDRSEGFCAKAWVRLAFLICSISRGGTSLGCSEALLRDADQCCLGQVELRVTDNSRQGIGCARVEQSHLLKGLLKLNRSRLCESCVVGESHLEPGANST
jgi:hypothetical protein